MLSNLIDGEWYISVKGTAKAYKKHPQSIKDHINKHPDIFKNHIILQNELCQKFFDTTSSMKGKNVYGKKWLDEIAFFDIGTLLNDSPITIPIKNWQREVTRRGTYN